MKNPFFHKPAVTRRPRPWAGTALLTLVSYLAATFAPAIAFAQDVNEAERMGGGTLSSREDRAGAAALGSGPAVAPTSVPGGAEKTDSESGAGAAEAKEAGAESADAAAEREAEGGAAEAANAVAPQTQALPSGDDKSGVTTQAISLPDGAGSIEGMGESFSAQLSTGIATFSVPFALPKARGGAQPSLGLSYSSAAGSSSAGQGWSVGVPFIARQTDRGLPKYDDRAAWHAEQDRFVFNGGQELVPICTVSPDGECSGALQQESDGTGAVTQPGEVMPEWAGGWQYFRPRVEGSFLRFFWSPDHLTWIVQDKSGTTMEIGVPRPAGGPAPGGAAAASTTALERNPERPGEIYRWHLSRQYDQHIESGVPLNTVVYAYSNVAGTAYLTDIYDTSPAAEPGTTDLNQYAHHTRLRWAGRPDPTESYRSGWLIQQTQRLAGVDVSSRTYLNDNGSASRHQVRRYHLSYASRLHRSVLEQLQVEGRCTTGGEDESAAPAENGDGQLPAQTGCGRLPPMTFAYSEVQGYQPGGTEDAAPLEGYMGFDGRVRELVTAPDHSLDEGLTDFFDINSDGLPDVLVTAPGLYGNDHAVFFNGEAGKQGFGGPTNMGVVGVLGANSNTIKLSNPNVALLDFDGDGQVNLLHMPSVKTYSAYDPRRVQGKWTWVGREITTASDQNPKIDFGRDTTDLQVMDVDFDGLVDVVKSSGTEYQTFFSLGRHPAGDGQFGRATRVSKSVSDLSNDPVTTCVPHSGLPIRFGDGETRLGDMNGDGITDIIRVMRGDIQYWPGRGNGFWGTGDRDDCPAGSFGSDRYIEMADAPNYSDVSGTTVKLGDVNGDGLDDLVQIRFDAVDIWLNVDGRGWTERKILDGTPRHAGYHNRLRITDVNGSATPDLVWGDASDYKYIDLQGGQVPYLLVGVENGLGKSTEIEYSTSAREMLAAEAQGACPSAGASADPWSHGWCSKMPTVTSVVKRVVEHDNITIRGRPPASYVTEYDYRDPYFEGRQREFRGFARARARRIGDANSPTDLSESVFLLGECRDPADGSRWDGVDQSHYCAPPNRWADQPYEALKGLPVETHKYDLAGTHLASTENLYTLRTLYQGLDGRAVRHAFLSQTDSLLYDTAQGPQARVDIAREGYQDEGGGASPPATAEPAGPSAYPAGMAHLRSASQVDHFGNKTRSDNFGCVGGPACTALPTAEETISQVTMPELLPHGSGWMWRTVEGFVVGSVQTSPRGHTWTTYDALGRPVLFEAELQGTEALWRNGTLTAAPEAAQAAADGRFAQSATAYDSFGNAIRTRAANGRCAEVDYGDAHALFASAEGIFTADGGPVLVGDPSDPGAVPSCSGPELVSVATYDMGLGVVTDAWDINSRPTRAVYDQFGRITELYKPSASSAGLSAAASVKIDYLLPGCSGCPTSSLPAGAKHSIIHTSTQDGQTEDSAEALESYAYVDGFGRTLVTLGEADPEAGDGAAWIAGSLMEWDQKSAVSKKYLEFFFAGAPTAFDYADQPTTAYGRQRYDAFGRQVQTYDLDGTITLQSRYHALATDLWDAADLYPGAHQHTYASEQKDGHGRTVRTTERFRASGVVEERHVETEYLPTGEPTVLRRVRGNDQVVRWMRYDSLGRMVLNVEPNTSVGFQPDPSSGVTQAWRYAYSQFGDLVATSDARGCGQNFFYDGAGRILGEDYVGCEAHHPAYSAPASGGDLDNLEVAYFYDSAANVPAGLTPSGWTGGYTLGRAVAVFDRASATFTTYDGRGRQVQTQTRISRPDSVLGSLNGLAPALRYAPRVYSRSTAYDAADREVSATTGAAELAVSAGTSSTELLAADGSSTCTTEYSARGAVKTAGSSYGTLVTGIQRSADNLVHDITYGDAADTTTSYLYDERRRISSVMTYRGPPQSTTWNPTGQASEPTQQLVLQDQDFSYDVVGNPTEIRDWRDPADWPAGAKPVTKKIKYDDLYRAVDVRYEYADGDDAWQDPHSADMDSDGPGDSRRGKPSPHISFQQRILQQTFQYDWLGNSEKTTDDAGGFYDRSLGDIQNGTSAPYRLEAAELSSPGARAAGQLQTAYDASGNMIGLAVQRAENFCIQGPSSGGSACTQLYRYQWDEVGRLTRARRWDGANANPQMVDGNAPNQTPAADLRYSYDAADQRVLKQAVDANSVSSFTVYVFETLELRRTTFSADDYAATEQTVVPYLLANGVRLARVVYDTSATSSTPPATGPNAVSQHPLAAGNLHVFFELGDHLGSTTVVLDKSTGELVEKATYQAYGGAESDYRPTKWNNFREDYRFTGKEEDVEVGLQYFGKRYLNPLLGRWISADPLAVHAPGEADFNLYAYVSGQVLRNVDPLGLNEMPAGEVFRQSAESGVKSGDMSEAVRQMNGLEMGEMLSYTDRLSGEAKQALSQAVGEVSGVDARRMKFALDVVSGRALPKNAPLPQDQVETATAFLAVRRLADVAYNELAKGVKEVKGNRESGEIMGYINSLPGAKWFIDSYHPKSAQARGIAKSDADRKIAWCAAFVNYVMEHGNQEGPERAGALSIHKGSATQGAWGREVKDPTYMAVVVLKTPAGHHTGFVVGRTEGGGIAVLGGNQDDSLSIKEYGVSQVVAYRLPKTMATLAADSQLPVLKDLGRASSDR